jgi:hypothetical protein
MTSVVPFGKYKGQPVEALIADADYCEWLAGQPWFRDRFSGIYQIIINGAQQPTETPEHNEMQSWFLKDDFCLALARFLVPNGGLDRDGVPWPDPLLRAYQARPDDFERIRHPAEVVERTFEDRGWDVAFFARKPWDEVHRLEKPCVCDCSDHSRCAQDGRCVGGTGYCGHQLCVDGTRRVYHCNKTCPAGERLLGGEKEWWPGIDDGYRILVECKPDLGDDFPAVLRQVKSYPHENWREKRCVLVRRFAFERVGWSEVAAMFAASQIALVVVGDITSSAAP